MTLSKILNREHYFPKTFRVRIIIAVGFGLTILLILLVFTPFGMHKIKTFPERFLVSSGYSFIAFIVWFLALNGLIIFKVNKISFLHILLFIIAIQFLIGSLSTIYNNIIFRNPYYFEFFLDLQIAVYLTGIIPTIMLILLLETSFYKRLFPSIDLYNNQVAGDKSRIEMKIEDENPDKSIHLFYDEILCISSMDNYIKIEIQNNGKKKKPIILRNTLKNIEKNISESDSFIRCHKSHIVNLKWVKEVLGNSLAKKCIMQIGNDIIPISRSKVDLVLKRIRELK
ncbi:MAG: LytTR family DNA-binding domain-containing protein [Bacteroidia bacterium]|nr:LytTR family DNA-binding domain-containing protein [Bacteroidia bacterium]